MKYSKVIAAAFISGLMVFGLFVSDIQGRNFLDFWSDAGYTNNPFVSQVSSGEYDLDSKFEELLDKARTDGKVRVIVGFKLENYRLDADLSESGQTDQRAAIKEKQASLLNNLNDFSVNEVKKFDYIPFLAMEVSADALAALRGLPDVIYIQEDQWREPLLPQSIPLIGADAAAAGGWTGTGWTVAVLDSGVDKFHPFFNNRVVSEACYSSSGAGLTSTCPGGATASTASGSGLHCDVSQVEGCFHGTHVAGISSGGHPQITGWGVARNSNIIAIQVFTYLTSNCGSEPAPCIRTSDSDWARGLERVYALRTTYNIAAANMSLGGGQYSGYCDAENALGKAAIDNLRSAGIATVIASGNSSYTSSMGSPACISTAISVGSTNDGDVLPVDFVSNFSNSTSFLNLLAPGELILSAYPGGNYHNTQGTSMAAPMVAGAWAVMKQRYPSDTVTQILTRLRYSGVQVLDSRNGVVKPRLKLDTALNTSNVDPCSSTAPITFGQTINGSFSNTDCLLLIGSRADIYTFNGTQGQGVSVTHSSSAFFPYVYLFDANFNLVGQGGGLSPARIPAGSGFLTLPSTGTYYIFVTSVEGNKFGSYTLNLATNGCSFTITSSGQNFAAAGGSGNFNVNSSAGCAWTAQSSASWLTTNSSGSGNGTVNYTVAQNPSSAQRTATISAGGQIHTVTQAGATTVSNRPYDFDGDGKSDISVFRPSNGAWYLLRSSAGFTGLAFGFGTDLLAPADFDGDGKTDVAVFRNGAWYYLRSSDNGFVGVSFGQAGDLPRPADFDGDGKADINVFRPSNGAWYRLNSSNGAFIGQQFGQNGDNPLIADFDGDGKSDIAVFRPSSNGVFFWLESSTAAFRATAFGFGTDIPTTGDFDGDGKTDIAVFRPSNGAWYRYNSSNGAFVGEVFGQNGDVPVSGDYDGDGKTDIAVFRSGVWYILQSSNGAFTGQAFGISIDKPIPAAFQ